jgi:hypothetical protein
MRGFPTPLLRNTAGAPLFLPHRFQTPMMFSLHTGGKILETAVQEGRCRSLGRG